MTRIPKTERDETLAATRQRLLDSALAEFAKHGYDQANINRISEAAGYSKGTIYNYFQSKQALMLALITETGKRHVEYIAGRVRQENHPAKRVEQFYEAGFGFVEEYPIEARFLIATFYSPGAELQQAMFKAYQPMFQLVAQEIITPGVEQGAFRPLDPVETANLLMTLYLGTSSNTDKNGKVFISPLQVADFVLHALYAERLEASRDTEIER